MDIMRVQEKRPVGDINQQHKKPVTIEVRVVEKPAGAPLSVWETVVADDTPLHDWQPEAA